MHADIQVLIAPDHGRGVIESRTIGHDRGTAQDPGNRALPYGLVNTLRITKVIRIDDQNSLPGACHIFPFSLILINGDFC